MKREKRQWIDISCLGSTQTTQFVSLWRFNSRVLLSKNFQLTLSTHNSNCYCEGEIKVTRYRPYPWRLLFISTQCKQCLQLLYLKPPSKSQEKISLIPITIRMTPKVFWRAVYIRRAIRCKTVQALVLLRQAYRAVLTPPGGTGYFRPWRRAAASRILAARPSADNKQLWAGRVHGSGTAPRTHQASSCSGALLLLFFQPGMLMPDIWFALSHPYSTPLHTALLLSRRTRATSTGPQILWILGGLGQKGAKQEWAEWAQGIFTWACSWKGHLELVVPLNWRPWLFQSSPLYNSLPGTTVTVSPSSWGAGQLSCL